MVTQFDDRDIAVFPDPESALVYPDGFLAFGGNLSVKTLSAAYESGIFPWFSELPIQWWSPAERAIIEAEKIHIAKNMKKLIRQNKYHVTADKAFDSVIKACAQPYGAERSGTWILDTMQAAYTELFNVGLGHSVEVWNAEGKLVGGLYGVFIKNCFCGESMFSIENNTSKLALIALAQFLSAHGCQYIDCQMQTKHLQSMGATVWQRATYLELLKQMSENKVLAGHHWSELWQPLSV